jgi:hypothetical protein
MHWELWPSDSESPPIEPLTFEIAWDATDWWAAEPVDGDIPQKWTHATRARVHETAVIGRVQEEPLGLLRLVAGADPASLEALPADKLDGKIAERWLVPVPVVAARAIYVPPDTYLAFDTIFDVDALPLEIWLVNGRVARVGYVFEREKGPYGGSDRIETWFDWSDVGKPIDLEIPPAGEIVLLPS